MSIKRVAALTGLAVLLLALSVVALFAVTFMGLKPAVDGHEANGVRIVQDGRVTLAVVPVGNGRVALIDAGNDPSGAPILAELSRRGLGPDAVTAIFLTHGHPDHTAATRQFANAQVMALEAEAPVIEGRSGTRGPLPRLFPPSPTGITIARMLKDGETVTVGEVAVRVFAVPGHTAGSAAYLANGVLFIGDSANATGGDTLQGAPWVFSDSQPENRAALVRLSRRLADDRADVRFIAPSHSGAIAGGLAPLERFAADQP